MSSSPFPREEPPPLPRGHCQCHFLRWWHPPQHHHHHRHLWGQDRIRPQQLGELQGRDDHYKGRHWYIVMHVNVMLLSIQTLLSKYVNSLSFPILVPDPKLMSLVDAKGTPNNCQTIKLSPNFAETNSAPGLWAWRMITLRRSSRWAWRSSMWVVGGLWENTLD